MPPKSSDWEQHHIPTRISLCQMKHSTHIMPGARGHDSPLPASPGWVGAARVFVPSPLWPCASLASQPLATSPPDCCGVQPIGALRDVKMTWYSKLKHRNFDDVSRLKHRDFCLPQQPRLARRRERSRLLNGAAPSITFPGWSLLVLGPSAVAVRGLLALARPMAAGCSLAGKADRPGFATPFLVHKSCTRGPTRYV